MGDRPAIYLEPDPAMCPKGHPVDLAPRAREEVERIPIKNASYVDGTGPTHPFTVVVTCPGDSAGASHRVTIQGIYR